MELYLFFLFFCIFISNIVSKVKRSREKEVDRPSYLASSRGRGDGERHMKLKAKRILAALVVTAVSVTGYSIW